MRCSRLLLTIGLLIASSAAPPALSASAAADEPLTYEYVAFPGCPLAGPPQIYDVCRDQMAVLAYKLDEAKTQGKLLLAVLGGTWCPSCKVLHEKLPGDEILSHKGDDFDYGRRFHVAEIPISAVYGGRILPVPSGKAIVEALPGAKLRAVPFLAFIDPVSMQVWTRNTDDLEMASGEGQVVDPAKIRKVMRTAYGVLREGKAPEDEPGWFKRKLGRLLGW